MMLQILRKSFNVTNKIYFFTATIHNWFPLLAVDNNQKMIIDYLKKLSDEEMITVFAFVLMPNHIHFIWRQNKLNGKETPQGSFLKYTAHEFLKKLKISALVRGTRNKNPNTSTLSLALSPRFVAHETFLAFKISSYKNLYLANDKKMD